MSSPRPDEARTQGAVAESTGSVPDETATSTSATPASGDRGLRRATASRRPASVPSTASADEAEAAYIAARDAWTAAMRASTSGRPADLAALAIAQEAYEATATERDRWARQQAVAIPIEAPAPLRNLDIVVGQEAEWRRVKQREADGGGLIGRVKRLFGG